VLVHTHTLIHTHTHTHTDTTKKCIGFYKTSRVLQKNSAYVTTGVLQVRSINKKQSMVLGWEKAELKKHLPMV